MTKEELISKVDQHHYQLLPEVQKFVHLSGEQDSAYIGENSNMFYIYRNGGNYNLKKVIK